MLLFVSILGCDTNCYKYSDSKTATIYFRTGDVGDTVKITQCSQTTVSGLKMHETWGISGYCKIKDQGTVHISFNKNENELSFSPNKMPYHFIYLESGELIVISSYDMPYLE